MKNNKQPRQIRLNEETYRKYNRVDSSYRTTEAIDSRDFKKLSFHGDKPNLKPLYADDIDPTAEFEVKSKSRTSSSVVGIGFMLVVVAVIVFVGWCWWYALTPTNYADDDWNITNGTMRYSSDIINETGRDSTSPAVLNKDKLTDRDPEDAQDLLSIAEFTPTTQISFSSVAAAAQKLEENPNDVDSAEYTALRRAMDAQSVIPVRERDKSNVIFYFTIIGLRHEGDGGAVTLQSAQREEAGICFGSMTIEASHLTPAKTFNDSSIGIDLLRGTGCSEAERLPQDVLDVIKPSQKKFDCGYGSTETTTVETLLFVPSATEVYGNSGIWAASDGTQYEYYAQIGITDRNYSALATDADRGWWTRSHSGTDGDSYVAVTESGSPKLINPTKIQCLEWQAYVIAFSI